MLSNMFFKKSEGIYQSLVLHLIILYKGTILSLGIFCHHSIYFFCRFQLHSYSEAEYQQVNPCTNLFFSAKGCLVTFFKENTGEITLNCSRKSYNPLSNTLQLQLQNLFKILCIIIYNALYSHSKYFVQLYRIL